MRFYANCNTARKTKNNAKAIDKKVFECYNTLDFTHGEAIIVVFISLALIMIIWLIALCNELMSSYLKAEK